MNIPDGFGWYLNGQGDRMPYWWNLPGWLVRGVVLALWRYR